MPRTMTEPTSKRSRTDRAAHALTRMADELHRHLADITNLYLEVNRARSSGLDPLFDELADTLEEHHAMISEQVRALGEPLPVGG